MQNFHKLSSNCDVATLTFHVKQNNHLWVNIEDKNLPPTHPGYSHREGGIILLRMTPSPPDAETDPDAFKKSQDELMAFNCDTWHMFSQARPFIYWLMHAVGGTHIGRLAFIRLMPGKQIYPHCDTGLSTEFYDRYHLSLSNPTGSVFICGEDGKEETVEMEPGSLWWFNSHLRHSVVNNGDEPRISLAMDISSI